MPELPEVETMRRGVAGAKGCRISEIGRVRCRLRPIEVEPTLTRMRRRVIGKHVSSVDRLGKRVVLRLEDDDRIIIEPRMAGLVLVADPPDRSHLRFRIGFQGGSLDELFYWDRRGLGSVRLLSDAEYQQRLGPHMLGPDALSITSEAMQSGLESSRRAVKVALLDQRAIAGIGNLYAAEILFQARIHPERTCRSLRDEEWDALHASMLDVLHTAIRYEGSTLGDGTYRTALNQPGEFQNKHLVYARAGKPCVVCGREIKRIVQAQRSTFFCPHCQPRRRKAASATGSKRR